MLIYDNDEYQDSHAYMQIRKTSLSQNMFV